MRKLVYNDSGSKNSSGTRNFHQKLQSGATSFFKEIEELNNVSFPQSLTPLNTIGLQTLCIFADGSRACSYLRWKKSSGDYKSRFISAKSRVAPVKELTIP